MEEKQLFLKAGNKISKAEGRRKRTIGNDDTTTRRRWSRRGV